MRRLWNGGKARCCNAETEAAAALASYARCVKAQWVKLGKNNLQREEFAWKKKIIVI